MDRWNYQRRELCLSSASKASSTGPSPAVADAAVVGQMMLCRQRLSVHQSIQLLGNFLQQQLSQVSPHPSTMQCVGCDICLSLCVSVRLLVSVCISLVYACVCLYTILCVCMSASICLYLSVCICLSVPVWPYLSVSIVCLYLSVSICVCLYLYLCVCLCLCLSVSLYLFASVCICLSACPYLSFCIVMCVNLFAPVPLRVSTSFRLSFSLSFNRFM